MRPEQNDTQASELQCFQDLYDIYIGTKKKVTDSGHVGTSDYLNTKAGTCTVNRVQQTQDIFIWFQREPVSGHIHMKDLKHRQV